MEDVELMQIWKDYDRKLEEARVLNLQSWALNIQSFEMMQSQKAKSALRSMIPIKKLMIVLGVIWVLFLGFLVINSLQWSKIFFVISVSAIVIINIIAIIVYIRHLVVLNEIDNSDSIVATQEKLAKMQTSTLNIARILFLQAPFHTTWWWTVAMIKGSLSAFFFISLPITLLFAWIGVWLYRNINLKNANKKWFKLLMSTKEWTGLTKAMTVLTEIDEFKKDKV